MLRKLSKAVDRVSRKKVNHGSKAAIKWGLVLKWGTCDSKVGTGSITKMNSILYDMCVGGGQTGGHPSHAESKSDIAELKRC